MSADNPKAQQRSHVLCVLATASQGNEAQFERMYLDPAFRAELGQHEAVVDVRVFKRSPVDLSGGMGQSLDFTHLTLLDLRVDGAEDAVPAIDHVAAVHGQSGVAKDPATWLFRPVTEKVGDTGAAPKPLAVFAFTNGVPGKRDEYLEFYATRHIRHALYISTFAGSQLTQKTSFQKPGRLPIDDFECLTCYDLVGTAEELPAGVAAVRDRLAFPLLDHVRFAEYICERI
ncbi:MAG: hypothetical protein QM733_09630 [Ilumatobacteraceae bacterium]